MDDPELVIFDLAGTIIEDSGQAPEAFTRVLNSYGFQLTADALQSIRVATK